ncbi:hypothetical protein PAGA_a1044 [Pseudoalteromonas agarivorans DSM 14585]|uniref:Uncharacterized protein n=1 Tax=Pseudoalteromonas agarivorans DSM 14585 TaxID=1312369 RepID=A0ACA8DU69_9GAMM|nr:hypothetical protein PAGA_a1044 [Pseudoalteromonas agarivorans DSM 14585]
MGLSVIHSPKKEKLKTYTKRYTTCSNIIRNNSIALNIKG